MFPGCIRIKKTKTFKKFLFQIGFYLTVRNFLCIICMYDCPDGGMVDTLVSGTRARKGVQVQVLFRAISYLRSFLDSLFYLERVE